MNEKEKNIIVKLSALEEGKFYRVDVLQAILKDLGLNHSIFTIRDYETWKCLDYKCGHRHNQEVSVCEGIIKEEKDPVTGEIKIEKRLCGGPVRPPLIKSPRTRGGGKGPGHRRYTMEEIKQLVDIFKERK